ncbi:2OG-Fe(II) oxygenase [Laspinema olomoucense]|uniref:2OG-Fe(II) oxygenase n=1 Tax=Laspinema olomoucense TaxID=3231600 RepID=UPI0021BB1F60|nr:2OG-Fe(II) oxygenase [Laspinema sp. D3c]MCT7992715.1 2OG-Fe(II) oxygenase [Laspinema sp. D3c]
MTSNLTEIQTVHVMLLIAGGHQCELSLAADSPLLQDILEAIALRSHPERSQPNKLFQIPMEDGGPTLYFPSRSIVAIATDPPVPLPEIAPEPEPIGRSAAANAPILIKSRFLKIQNFLSEAENQRILNYVIENQREFEDSKVGTSDPNYRRSKIFYYFDEFGDLIRERIKQNLPQVREYLGVPPFEIAEIESQITAHNDGHYYKAHNDNGDEVTATRTISYIYYFHREPKPFSGGELRMYDTWKLGETNYSLAETYTDIPPTNNSIVFFVSNCCHEVRPIICPSKDFKNSRFTLNGWIRKEG